MPKWCGSGYTCIYTLENICLACNFCILNSELLHQKKPMRFLVLVTISYTLECCLSDLHGLVRYIFVGVVVWWLFELCCSLSACLPVTVLDSVIQKLSSLL